MKWEYILIIILNRGPVPPEAEARADAEAGTSIQVHGWKIMRRSPDGWLRRHLILYISFKYLHTQPASAVSAMDFISYSSILLVLSSMLRCKYPTKNSNPVFDTDFSDRSDMCA